MKKILSLFVVFFLFALLSIFFEGVLLHYGWTELAVPSFNVTTLSYTQCFVLMFGLGFFRYFFLSTSSKEDSDSDNAVADLMTLFIKSWIVLAVLTCLIFLMRLFLF